VPDLGRIDAMPARDLARLEEKIDRGGTSAAATFTAIRRRG
jgi:hypothetical protein